MKNLMTPLIFVAAFLAVMGCSNSTAPSSAKSSPSPTVEVAYALGSIKKGDKVHCVVCAIKEGSRETEPASETLDYKGKTYAFCNEKEKAEFISDPAKYAVTAQ